MIDLLCKPIINKLNINKFIETGTFEGETVAQVAVWFSELHREFGLIEKLVITEAKGMNPWNSYIAYPKFQSVNNDSNFKIYSVDTDPKYYQTAKEVFSSNSNIIIEYQSSEQFLRNLIDSGTIGENDNVFCYLDAHW